MNTREVEVGVCVSEILGIFFSSFKKFRFADVLDDTEDDSVWESLVLNALVVKRSARLYSERKEDSENVGIFNVL
jgi:hypothetical protein